MALIFKTRVWLSPTVSLDYETQGCNKIAASKSVLDLFKTVYAIKTVRA